MIANGNNQEIDLRKLIITTVIINPQKIQTKNIPTFAAKLFSLPLVK